MPDAEYTVEVTEEPVLDVAGDGVSDSALSWIVFIALHLDEDRYFRVDELVDDTLLALGYREGREELGRDGEPHAKAVYATVQQLIEKGLVERDTEPDVTRYRLTKDVVEDIRNVRARIGQFWGFAGSEDAIDTYAELGLLVIIALRIQDNNRASRDDLADRLASLLGDRDAGARGVALTELLSRLKMYNYLGVRRDPFEVNVRALVSRVLGIIRAVGSRNEQVFGVDWALNEKAWDGVSRLRQALRDEFGNEVLPDATDRSQELQRTNHEGGSSTPDDLVLADSSRDGVGLAPSSSELKSFPMPDVEELAWALIQALRASGSLSFDVAQDGVLDRMGIPRNAGILQRVGSASESRFEHGLRRARLALQHRAKVVRVRHDAESGGYLLVLQPAGGTISRSKVAEAVRQNEAFIASGAQDSKRRPDPVRDSLPSESDLASEMRKLFSGLDDSSQLSVQEINEHLERSFELSDEQLSVPHNPQREDSELELAYRARRARHRLRREGEIQTTSRWEDGPAGPQEGPHDTYSPGRSLDVDRDPAGTTDTDQWAYDHRKWCWLTLEVMRDLSQDVVDEEIPNGTISGALADRLQLSPAARNVRSSQNPAEKEYTARCATMRELLAEIELIERGGKSATWRILPKGEDVSEDDLTALIEDTNVDVLSGANGAYRGNDELEAVIAQGDTSRVGQAPAIAVRSEEDRAADAAGSDSARATGSPPDVFGDHGLSDVQLCVAILESLPTEEGEFLRHSSLVDAVRDKLAVSATYSGLPAPHWVGYDSKRKSTTLLEYRIEHVVRALSIERSGLIRDGGLDFHDAGDMWFLTARGRRVVQGDDVAGQVARMTAEYFAAHDYANWTGDDWKGEVIDILWESKGDGTGFEHLVAALLAAQQDIERADVQPPGRYLDSMGVDVVAKVRQGHRPAQVQVGTVSVETGQRAAVLLVQCKRYRSQQISPDAASKLFGFTARLRDQATRGDVQYDVAGGLIAFFGDLTRDATWTFWALRAAWGALGVVEADRRDQTGQEPEARRQPNVHWETWDGQRIFALMKEHQIGVDVADSGEVTVDREYLRSLLRGGERGRET